MMKVAHLLRKYNPSEWAGTEMAVLNLCKSLRQQGIESIIFCPTIENSNPGPFELAGFEVKRGHSFLPYFGLTKENRTSLISIGGNLLSLKLFRELWREPELSIIHSHAMGIFGASAQTIARRRRIPLVLSIHGGALDLPAATKEALRSPLKGSFMWGRPISWLLGARHLLRDADLITTCNPTEARLLRIKYPHQKVAMNPSAIDAAMFRSDQRAFALSAFPHLKDKDLLIIIGRIDPIKNQGWVIEQLPWLKEKLPQLKLLLVGPCTNKPYEKELKQRLADRGLSEAVEFFGEIPFSERTYTGLLQLAKGLILPSLSETFGLAILEAWAAGTPVIASRTSGALSLIDDRKTGWLYDLDKPLSFKDALTDAFENPSLRKKVTTQALKKVEQDYDIPALGKHVKNIYEALIQGNWDEISDFTRR